MIINPTIKNVTDRITKRSETTRSDYLEKMNGARKEGFDQTRHLHPFSRSVRKN